MYCDCQNLNRKKALQFILFVVLLMLIFSLYVHVFFLSILHSLCFYFSFYRIKFEIFCKKKKIDFMNRFWIVCDFFFAFFPFFCRQKLILDMNHLFEFSFLLLSPPKTKFFYQSEYIFKIKLKENIFLLKIENKNEWNRTRFRIGLYKIRTKRKKIVLF